MKCKTGYKKIKNKCKKKLFNVSTRSYSPFKMWGSWVGLIILPFTSIIYLIKLFIKCNGWCSEPTFDLIYQIVAIILIPILMIIGFIIGFAITILWRKFKK